MKDRVAYYDSQIASLTRRLDAETDARKIAGIGIDLDHAHQCRAWYAAKRPRQKDARPEEQE